MVLGHPAENVVQHHDRFIDVRSLVQHDAFGTLPHRGVADLGARRQPALGELLENLRRPDHRQVRGLTQPQNLFLQFGQPFVAHLDREVAARDHHADSRSAHRGQ